MKYLAFFISQIILLSILAIPAFTQECKPPKIVFNNNADNIFTEEQEMYLGEAMAQRVQKDFRVIEDAEVNSYIRNIGERVIKNLPETSLKFQFHVVDLPEVNAFAMPGGRIFITRKLIAFVRSEDELAGIIAHELGHGIVRHGAIDMSTYFKKLLNIEKVGDRKDVFDKYNQFLEKRNTKRIRSKNSHEGKQQLEADKIGVFAMNAAGYDPAAFTSAFDRLAQTEGKTGGFFSDLFGATSPGEKRLREIINAVKQIPAECIDKNQDSKAAFEEWRTAVITYSDFEKNERVSGLIRRKTLTPSLRDDITHLEFSPDGKYIIAQDDSSIFVLQKDPYKFLFRINSPEANNASFTIDSKFVVFNTPNLRVERWDIAEQKPRFVKEIFVNQECFQTAISKDGNTFACFSLNVIQSLQRIYVDLKIFDVRTNEVIFEKDEFFRPHFIDFMSYRFLSSIDENTKMFQTEFSPDGRYLVIGRVFKNEERTQYTPNSGGGGFIKEGKAGKSGTLGFDLVKREEIEIGKNLLDIIVSPFTFLSNDKIIGQDRADEKNSGVFSFPSGKQVDKFIIKGNSFTRPHKGDYVLIRPLKTSAVGVYDLQSKKIVIANKTPAFDVYDNVFISENKTGELGLFSLIDDKLLGTVELPESRFGNIRALSVSPDLNWLAISDKDRGAIWSMYSGERYFYVQGFRSAYFKPDGKVYADFARTKQTARQVAVLNLLNKGFVSSTPLTTQNTTQYGKYLVTKKSNEEGKEKKTKTRDIKIIGITIGSVSGGGSSVSENGIVEVRDITSNEMLWTKSFPDEMPRTYFSESNQTVTLVWGLKSDVAKDAIKKDENLKKIATAMGDKDGDYFVQAVNAETGETLGQTLIETGEGSFRIRSAETAGNWLAVADSQNRVLFYSLTDGELKQRFFGSNFAINQGNNTVGIGNLSGKLIIYDLETGENIEQMAFDSPIAYAQYGKYGKKLLVLTTKQEVFILDTAKFGQSSTLATK